MTIVIHKPVLWTLVKAYYPACASPGMSPLLAEICVTLGVPVLMRTTWLDCSHATNLDNSHAMLAIAQASSASLCQHQMVAIPLAGTHRNRLDT